MNKEQMTINQLYDLTKTIAGSMMEQYTYPWEVLPHIGEMIAAISAILPKDDYNCISGNIWIHKSVQMPPIATVKGPAIICANTEVRPGAFIRGNVIVGEGAVVGNSTELKNVILFDGVQVPHYNYVGDSILGYKAHR